VLFAYNRQKLLILYAALGGGLNVLLDLVFIPRWGITGSAVATLLAQLASNWYLWRAINKLDNFSVLPKLKKIIIATCGMAILILALNYIGLHVLSIIVLAVVFYLAVLLVLREPFLEEILRLFHKETGRSMGMGSELDRL